MRDLVKTLGSIGMCVPFSRIFSCHGPDEHGRKADLKLMLKKNAKDSDFMAIVLKTNRMKAEMIFRIHSDDEDEIMPPPKLVSLLR